MRFIEKLNTPVAFLVALALVLVINGFLFYRYRLTEEAASTSPPPAVTEKASTTTGAEGTTKQGSATTQQGATTTPAEEAEVLRVAVGVVEAPAFLSIEVDGQNVFEGEAGPGFFREFEADREVALETGNAGAVEVEVDGENLGRLGASGEVVARTFRR